MPRPKAVDRGGNQVRNAIIGIIVGVVVGVAFGATIVAPRLGPEHAESRTPAKAQATLPPQQKTTPADKPDAARQAPATAAAPPPESVPVAVAPAAKPEQAPARPAEAEKPAAPTPSAVTSQPAAPVAGLPAKPAAAPTKPAELPATPPPPPAGQKTIHWKMGSAYGSNLPQLGTLAKRLDRDIWRVSDGRLEIKFHEPGALVPPLEMFDAVRAGAIDAAFSSPGFWGNKVPALQLFAAVPFGPSAKEYLAWIYFGGGKELFEDIYHANGIHSIFCGMIAPEASGWFKSRIRTVHDLQGLRMRIFGLGAKVVRKLGVTPTQLTDGDIYMAFESGAIDAAEFSMPAIDLKLGLQRMAKNYYFPGWHQPATLFELMINLDKWKALPVTAKAQVEAVCGDNIRYGLAEGEARQYAALKELQAQGVEFRRWPGEIMEALAAAWDSVVKEEIKADADFKKTWESLKAFRHDYAIWHELSAPY
jgi:TRAP-type mannitol/chloroaromatic compound transport system substrate-binding protein